MQRADSKTSLIGDCLGSYTIKQILGNGSMGAVYLAEQERIGKKVAIKVLHPEHVGNTEIAERFFQEARAVNEIDHPNIVDILDYKVTTWRSQPLAYFVMEYVDGQSLRALLRKREPLSIPRALHICRQVADGLAASHDKGIIHRDLKPANLMLTRRGREADVVKVLDFGIARLVEKPAGAVQTCMGRILGTPRYMAPEQFDGEADHRADIYSLGIVLYQLLTGKLPFAGKGHAELFSQHKTGMPTRPSALVPGMPPHLDVLVLKALAKSPDDRYPSMELFALALSNPDAFVTGMLRSMGPLLSALQDTARVAPMVLMPMPQRASSQPDIAIASSSNVSLVPPVAISHLGMTSSEWSYPGRPVLMSISAPVPAPASPPVGLQEHDISGPTNQLESDWFTNDDGTADERSALDEPAHGSRGYRRWLTVAAATLLIAGALFAFFWPNPNGGHAATQKPGPEAWSPAAVSPAEVSPEPDVGDSTPPPAASTTEEDRSEAHEPEGRSEPRKKKRRRSLDDNQPSPSRPAVDGALSLESIDNPFND